MKVLSIGAGPEQVFSIKEARKKGLFVIAIDGNRESQGFRYANISYSIDLKNKNKVIQIAKEHDIKFILPSPIGRFLTTIGAVNDALGLSGVSEYAAEAFTNKNKFYNLLKKAKLYAPKQIYIDCVNRSEKKIEDAIEAIGFPCILKTNEGSGSRGVIVVHSMEEKKNAILFHLNSVLETEGTLVETFVYGKEYGVDARIIDSELELLLIREKILTELPHRQEIGYIAPAKVNDKIKNEIEFALRKVVKELSVDTCLINADILVGEDLVFVVEASARPAGLSLMESFIPNLIGFNPLTNLIDVLAENDGALNPTHKSKMYYGLFFFDLPIGEIIGMPDKDRLITDGYALEYTCNLKIGETISIIKEGKDIFYRGSFIVKDKEIQQLEKKKEKVYSQFIIE